MQTAVRTLCHAPPKAERAPGLPSNPKLDNFIAGSIAGTIGTFFNTPFDVAKTRVQNALPGSAAWGEIYGGAGSSAGNGKNTTRGYGPVTLPLMGRIVREEGAAALWRGFVPKVVRLGPGGGIMLVVFEAVADFLAGR